MAQSDITERSDSTNNRKSRFNASDIAIFVLFPMLLLGGFLLFVHLKRTAADPNLRLIAQVTDDISVELVAVASQSRQKDGSIRWWKPNGLPADGIKDDPKGTIWGSADPGFYFLHKFSDDRSGKHIILGGLSSNGCASSSHRNDDEKSITVNTTAKPDIWSSVTSIVRIATEGNQYVGELTPEHSQHSTSVGGMPANIAVLSGQALKNATMYRPSPCVLKITEPVWKTNSQFSVEVYDEAGNVDKSVTNILGGYREHENLYFFNSRKWSRIVIHRTVYDIQVKFEGIS